MCVVTTHFFLPKKEILIQLKISEKVDDKILIVMHATAGGTRGNCIDVLTVNLI